MWGTLIYLNVEVWNIQRNTNTKEVYYFLSTCNLQGGVRRIVGKFDSKKPQLYAYFPTIRVLLGKCALIGQFVQYLEFKIALKYGQSKNFWWFKGNFTYILD